MQRIAWNDLKNARLQRTRGISFEEILLSKLIVVKDHQVRSDQKIMLFAYREYIWVVPFVEDAQGIFLKTVYPSRKYTNLYRKELLQ